MQTKLQHIRQLLTEKKIDSIFISKKSNITYLTGYKFLSETEREAFLFITHKKAYVITSQLYRGDVEKYVDGFEVLDFVEKGKSFWEFIDQALQKEAKEIAKVLQKDHVYKLGFESTNITVAEYFKLKKLKTKLVPLITDSIREIKTSGEIQKIQKACTLGDEAFSYILKLLKPGMTEKQVAFQIENYFRERGSSPSFPSVVAFGKGASVPHHTVTDTPLKKNDVVLLDFGAEVQSYCSDMSRTVFMGTPTTEQVKVYDLVRESQQKAFDLLQSTASPIPAKDVDTISRDYIKTHKYPEYPHSLGHSVGVEIHDGFALSPYSNFSIQPGMVFSIEPGIYLSGKFGVRIEDIVLRTKGGIEFLTKSSRELIVR